MKKSIVTLFLCVFFLSVGYAQGPYEFLQLSAVESVVQGKLGRSRLITTKPDGSQNEIKLQNFFSFVGINFGNLRSNDRLIALEIQRLSEEGWELMHITSASYAQGSEGKSPGAGIFLTRYLFRREKKE